MNSNAAVGRVKVSADGQGVVSHAGVCMLREVADLTGLSWQVTAALADTYDGPWIHAPGDVFTDLAAAVADGADCVDGVGQLLGDREQLLGVVASTTTLWRLVDERIDAAHLPAIRAARCHARARAWDAGAAPDHAGWLHLDVYATITIDHSDNKENAASTWKHTFGFHPLLVFFDRTDIAAGEALAGLLRAGNAGSNTTADHITVLNQALASLPARYHPGTDNPNAPQILIRSDSAGATYGFAAARRVERVGFSLGAVIDAAIRDDVVAEQHPRPATRLRGVLQRLPNSDTPLCEVLNLEHCRRGQHIGAAIAQRSLGYASHRNGQVVAQHILSSGDPGQSRLPAVNHLAIRDRDVNLPVALDPVFAKSKRVVLFGRNLWAGHSPWRSLTGGAWPCVLTCEPHSRQRPAPREGVKVLPLSSGDRPGNKVSWVGLIPGRRRTAACWRPARSDQHAPTAHHCGKRAICRC